MSRAALREKRAQHTRSGPRRHNETAISRSYPRRKWSDVSTPVLWHTTQTPPWKKKATNRRRAKAARIARKAS